MNNIINVTIFEVFWGIDTLRMQSGYNLEKLNRGISEILCTSAVHTFILPDPPSFYRGTTTNHDNTAVKHAFTLREFIGWKMKILHISHKLAYCFPKHQNNQGGCSSDSVILKTELGRFGCKIRIWHISHKLAYFVQNTKISNGEVLSDSVTLKTELGCFW